MKAVKKRALEAAADKKFTDWGSLLLSKQIRMLQGLVAKVLTPSQSEMQVQVGDVAAAAAASSNLIQRWERVSQLVTVLQLERPSDWLMYNQGSGVELTVDELRKTLSLRVDFSTDAINAVISQVEAASVTSEGK